MPSKFNKIALLIIVFVLSVSVITVANFQNSERQPSISIEQTSFFDISSRTVVETTERTIKARNVLSPFESVQDGEL